VKGAISRGRVANARAGHYGFVDRERWTEYFRAVAQMVDPHLPGRFP